MKILTKRFTLQIITSLHTLSQTIMKPIYAIMLCLAGVSLCQCEEHKTQKWPDEIVNLETHANAGDGVAAGILGDRFRKGEGVAIDHTQAFHWYQLGSRSGDPRSITGLGLCYSRGHACKRDYEKAYRLYAQAAELDHPPAITNLAYCYRDGRGCPKNRKLANQLYQRAMDMGHPRAFNNAGMNALYGWGTGKDILQGVVWVEKALSLGYEPAKLNLARFYTSKEGAIFGKAREGYQVIADLAEAGNPDAMLRRGRQFLSGEEVEMDIEKALEWMRKAGKAGSSDAYYVLARIYNSDEWLPKKPSQAIRYLEKSLTTNGFDGYTLAAVQYDLAKALCRVAEGVEQDLTRAYKLLEESAKGGHQDAEKQWLRIKDSASPLELLGNQFLDDPFPDNLASASGVVTTKSLIEELSTGEEIELKIHFHQGGEPGMIGDNNLAWRLMPVGKSREQIEKLAIALNSPELKGERIIIANNTFDFGDAVRDKDLSSRRAQEVVNLLVTKHGVDRKRLRASGRGGFSTSQEADREARAELMRRDLGTGYFGTVGGTVQNNRTYVYTIE